MQEIIDDILNEEACFFLLELHREFNERRLALLEERKKVQKSLDQGWNPVFLENRSSDWKVTSIPEDLEQRWVEITGPVEAKMMINALNSGADTFMADFEDSLAPTWENVIQGQANLKEAVRRQLKFTSKEGKEYQLNPEIATLIVRPRGWHLEEAHYFVDETPISASLFDFGLYFFHNAAELLKRQSGPYFYLAKLENSQEAALWRDVFAFAEKTLNISEKTIKATVLIETILAAFEMEEILFELKDYCVGLNAGRWDYIFSIIKKFSSRPFVFPDRSQIKMTVPFMKAYTCLLVATCHQHGAYAMGGMSAYVPSRKDPEMNERALEQVREDKMREAVGGFDGTWVAHPDLVPLARAIFEVHLKGQPNQLSYHPSCHVIEKDLLNFEIAGNKVTEDGLFQNVYAAVHYLDAWLKGTGAVTLHQLMEDAATAEIARAQIWQWVHKKAITFDHVDNLLKKESSPDSKAYAILKKIIEDEKFTDFLTLKAYPHICKS